jgi:hypothetical protein
MKPIIVIFWAAALWWIWLGDSSLSSNRNEQGKVLAAIEHVHDPRASAFVDEWQKAHTSPGASDIAALRILAERIQADPAQAVAYTADMKAKAQADAIDWNGWAPILISLGVGAFAMFVLGRM